MLRDFEHNPTSELVDVLRQFEFNLADEKTHFTLLKFEVITPDSFMWRFLINDGIYYMYAEDYIPSLDHVKKVFNAYLQSDTWDFINPDNALDGAVEYAVKSGYDYVFLAKSTEDIGDAQFSVRAPLGFRQ